jgi:hypothetical protein
MKYLRYSGEFLSHDSVRWRVEIWQESGTAYAVQELTFPAGEPLVIEWQGRDKLEPVQSSAATLRILSPSDRAYLGLYTAVAGSIRMDVYRSNALYWSGTLDPEIYEEPFAYLDGYVVSLTFADFAILDRLKFETVNNRHFISISEMISRCITLSEISTGALDLRISTQTEGGASVMNVYVIDENFRDEDDEPMTMREVLDGILRPLSLRMIQKAGRITIYDINALGNATQTVWWASTDSVLSMDVTYNNVEVNYSPYMRNKMIESELKPENIGNGITRRVNTQMSHSNDFFPGFDIRLSDYSIKNKELTRLSLQYKYFAINPIFSGDGDAGIAAVVRIWSDSSQSYESLAGLPASDLFDSNALLNAVRRPYLYLPANREDFLLKLKAEVMVDARYNPFEEPVDDIVRTMDEMFQHQANYCYIPFKLILRDENGTALYHYSNYDLYSGDFTIPKWQQTNAWKTGAGDWNAAKLAYYQMDNEDRKTKTGFRGWQTNKPIIGYWRKNLPSIYRRMNDGEYIPLPPASGWLEIQISGAFLCLDYGFETTLYYERIMWYLFKKLELTLVDKYGNDIDETDHFIRAWVTKTAKEDLSIDTILGTLPGGGHPTARGQFFTSTGAVVERFTRAGYTDMIDRLLAGTVYSQYYGRKKKLSGTVRLLPAFAVMTDDHEPGNFLVINETQDVIRDESRIEMVEIAPDSFQGVVYESE